MKNFEIPITLDGHHYHAEVSILQKEDHVQYTITPENAANKPVLNTQVIHAFPGKPLQVAFPGTNETEKEHAAAIVAALKKHLTSTP